MSALLKQHNAYLVPDLLQEGLKLVFCGTALGHESARQKAYYAHPGNLFWKALFRCGFTTEQIKPQDYPLLLNYGIGLTDLCKTHSGNDDDLPVGSLDAAALRHKILRYQPHWLAFTSKNAAAAFLGVSGSAFDYGIQPETVGRRTRMFVLPSPSGQARRFWREELWETLAREISQ